MRLHACTRTDEHEERRGAGHILELVAGDDARGEEGRDHAGGQTEGEADHAAGLFILILFGCDLRGVGLLSRQGSVETVGLVEFYFLVCDLPAQSGADCNKCPRGSMET